MSRLLYILICMDLCFSYNFIDKYGKYVKKHVGDRRGDRERSRDTRVVFDVGEFVKTEKSSDIDPNTAENKKEAGHIQSNYDYTGLINDITGNINENEYFNVKDSEIDKNLEELLSLDDSYKNGDSEFVKKDGGDGYQNKKLYEENLIHNPEKKCALKHMKVPFFSHSSSTTKSRKAKKKKFVCINCTKNEKNEPSSLNNTTLDKPKKRLSAFKYHKDMFKNFLGHKKMKEKVIHNCRQFYQNKAKIAESSSNSNELIKTTEQFTTEKVKANVDYNDEILDDNDDSESSNRIKRDNTDERIRRLKILDELEKKVDNTEIGSPTLTEAATSTSSDVTRLRIA